MLQKKYIYRLKANVFVDRNGVLLILWVHCKLSQDCLYLYLPYTYMYILLCVENSLSQISVVHATPRKFNTMKIWCNKNLAQRLSMRLECVCGYNVYQQVWEAAVKETLVCSKKQKSVMTDMLWLWKRMVLSSGGSVNSGLDYWTSKLLDWPLFIESHIRSIHVQLLHVVSWCPVVPSIGCSWPFSWRVLWRVPEIAQLLLTKRKVAVQSKWQEERTHSGTIVGLSIARLAHALRPITSVLYFDSLIVKKLLVILYTCIENVGGGLASEDYEEQSRYITPTYLLKPCKTEQ